MIDCPDLAGLARHTAIVRGGRDPLPGRRRRRGVDVIVDLVLLAVSAALTPYAVAIVGTVDALGQPEEAGGRPGYRRRGGFRPAVGVSAPRTLSPMAAATSCEWRPGLVVDR